MAESNKRRPLLNKATKGPLIWIVMALLVVSIGALLFSRAGFSQIDTEQGLKLLADDKVEQVKIVDRDQRVDLTLKDDLSIDGQDFGKKVQFYYVEPRGDEVVKAVAESNPTQGYTDEVPQQSWLMSLLGTLIPFVIIFVVFWFLISQMSGGKMMNFGKSKAKLVNKENPDVTFKDVAGVDEALEELEEIKEFLAEPEKFKAVGAKIPKGVLLYGQPGTGKTLLAKAVAGEAGVPFYSISGSDFVEMYVASAPPGCATSSNRPRRTRPASSSSTRSTPSAASAAPAWAAATTSASRRSTSCSSRWTASTSRPTSSSSPRPTVPTSSTRHCCVPAASTGRSPSRRRT